MIPDFYERYRDREMELVSNVPRYLVFQARSSRLLDRVYLVIDVIQRR